MTWAYSPSYGKPLSVPQGVIALMTRFGMDVVLAHPEGYDLVDEPLDGRAPLRRRERRLVHRRALDGGGVRGRRRRLPEELGADGGDARAHRACCAPASAAELAELEREALATNARFSDWECDERLMARTRGGDALYLHCLPADVTGVSLRGRRGQPRRSSSAPASTPTARPSHKPFVIAAMILATRFADPAAVLASALERSRPRHLR